MTDKQIGMDEMKLRDFFAGMALQGLLTAELVGDYSNEHVADISYRLADAMIKERNGQN